MAATQLDVNTIRYGSDIFQFQDQAMVEATVPWYIHDIDKVTGFTFDTYLPDGTAFYFLFKVASKDALNLSEYEVYKFDENKKLVKFTEEVNLGSIVSSGNTLAELQALTDIPDFVNKKVLPIVAISSNTTGSKIPTMKFTLNAKTTDTHLTEERESEITSFGKEVYIKYCLPKTFITYYKDKSKKMPTVDIKASIRKNGVWCKWKEISEILRSPCDAIRFKYYYTVYNTSDLVQVTEMIIKYK